MDRMMALIGATAGGWAGFALGGVISTMTGLFVSLIGTAAGIWVAGRLTSSWM